MVHYGQFLVIWTICLTSQIFHLTSAAKNVELPMNKTQDLGIFTIHYGKPFFLVLMNLNVKFDVDYTVICEKESSNFMIEVQTMDDDVMTIVQDSSFPVSCTNASDVILQTTNSSNPVYTSGTSDENQLSESGRQRGVLGTFRLNMHGVLIGRTFVKIQLKNYTGKETETSGVMSETLFPVTVLRTLKIWDTIFRVLIYFFMVFVTLAFGCKLDLQIVKENLKRPVAPAIGFCCQFVLMPLIAYGVAKLVTTDSLAISLGIFLCGCCPGGGISNIYTHLLDGELSLSITMTAISTIAALGMFPLWAYTLGQQFVDKNANVHIPYTNIFTTLLILILPLFVGMFIKTKLPRLKRFLMKIITPVTVVTITFLLSVGIYTNLFIFKFFSPRIIFAGCLLPYCGYILSAIAALILRQDWKKTKTIAIETGIQNVGIAVLVMMFAFPPPDGEIAAIAPIASGVMTPLPLFLLTIVYMIYKRCNKDKYAAVSTKNKDATKNGDVTLEVNEKEMEALNGKEIKSDNEAT